MLSSEIYASPRRYLFLAKPPNYQELSCHVAFCALGMFLNSNTSVIIFKFTILRFRSGLEYLLAHQDSFDLIFLIKINNEMYFLEIIR